MKILYVENNRFFFEAVKKEFLSEYELHNEASVKDAIAAYSSEKYDLVLVDYDLDDAKGEELVSHIREKNQKIPIIAVSSHEMGNQKMLNAGATASCGKMQFRGIGEIITNVTTSEAD